jgi:hypothetical protein
VAHDATRRRVLAAAAMTLPLVAAGCKGIGALGTPPKPAADVAVVRAAIAMETQLIARYGAVLGALPQLAPVLRPLLAQHHEHLTRLRSRLIIPQGARPVPSARAPRHGTAPVPGTTQAALASLRDAETAAATALLAHLTAAPESLAQLLASISASEATHAMILGQHP